MKKHGFLFLSIFLGGALGTVFRFSINMQVSQIIFPIGTLVENVVGSFLLGILTGYVLSKKMNPYLKEGLGVGFCGGFTTMSTLAVDTVVLATQSTEVALLIYVAGSLFGGLAMAMIGIRVSTAYVNRTRQTDKAGEVE